MRLWTQSRSSSRVSKGTRAAGAAVRAEEIIRDAVIGDAVVAVVGEEEVEDEAFEQSQDQMSMLMALLDL